MFRRNQKLTSYLIFAALAFLFLIGHIPFLKRMKFAAVDTMSLPVRIITFPFIEIKKMLLYHYSFEENQRLTEEIAVLRGRLVAMDEVTRQNLRFEKLLNLKQKFPQGTVANVIERDLSNWNSAVIIDRGSRDGLAVGMPVVDEAGIVGKVVEVIGHRAKVILLSDPSFSVPAMVQRSRESGLVSGTLNGQCRMRYVAADADVGVGDAVISSKLSSSFPEGLLVGTVVAVENSGGSPFPTFLIKPDAPLSQIEEVLVIFPSP